MLVISHVKMDDMDTGSYASGNSASENLKELSIQVMYIKEWEKSKITE